MAILDGVITLDKHYTMTVPLLQTEKLAVCYDGQEETLLIEWRGEVSSQELREGYSQIIAQVRRLKPVKWQLDLQQRGTIKREDQRWIFEFVFPEVLAIVNDNVFVAVVLPVFLLHDLVSELNGDELMQEGNFLIMQHFMYPEQAQRWLNEMHQIKTGTKV
ncbi:hypothetical protein [Pontibacter flavimaris]|uniref:STAS/SEC14 domain-containing protein n=1 Tax=Pontibacter flavimaris TaxID=1797110 RepID=A0A1Q5PHG9_9BACT|nr:hypothetical protein [Pontibacter flavimaris]OKL41669.1 hypothetical protein A3841_11600 [Pontibacter flavimaris]